MMWSYRNCKGPGWCGKQSREGGRDGRLGEARLSVGKRGEERAFEEVLPGVELGSLSDVFGEMQVGIWRPFLVVRLYFSGLDSRAGLDLASIET